MNDSSYGEVPLFQGANSSFQKYPSMKRDARITKTMGGNQILRKLTIGYRLCLQTIDPTLTHIKLPQRILTVPSDGLFNDGLDNVTNDYILKVNDQIINEKKKQCYIIDDLLGRGTFGQVVKCHKENTKEYFAIKVIKNQPAYNAQCITEIEILKTLLQQPSQHIIPLMDQFIHKKHICLLFPILSYSLLDVLRDNRYIGLGVKLTRKWITKILQGLLRVEECGIVHADLKPENIMIEEDRDNLENSNIRIIDFGSSCFLAKKPPYTYIQSRFYRAPEIILRQSSYSSKIDLWSLGCIAAELICGIALFPGADEYTCLSRILEVTEQQVDGQYIQKSEEWDKFFDLTNDGKFVLKSQEQFEKEQNIKVQGAFPVSHPIQRLVEIKNDYEESLDLASTEPSFEIFLDFIKRLLTLKPEHRMSASEAVDHPFILEKIDEKATSYEGFIVTKSQPLTYIDILQLVDTNCDIDDQELILQTLKFTDHTSIDHTRGPLKPSQTQSQQFLFKQVSQQKSDTDMNDFVNNLMSDDDVTEKKNYFTIQDKDQQTVINLYENKFKLVPDDTVQGEESKESNLVFFSDLKWVQNITKLN